MVGGIGGQKKTRFQSVVPSPTPLQFVLYLEQHTRKTKLKEANHALSWVHEIAGLLGSGTHLAVQAVLEGGHHLAVGTT